MDQIWTMKVTKNDKRKFVLEKICLASETVQKIADTLDFPDEQPIKIIVLPLSTEMYIVGKNEKDLICCSMGMGIYLNLNEYWDEAYNQYIDSEISK